MAREHEQAEARSKAHLLCTIQGIATRWRSVAGVDQKKYFRLFGITQVITNMMFSFYPTVNIQFRGFSLIKICSPDDFIIRAMAV